MRLHNGRLTGIPPFNGANVNEVVRKNKECKIDFSAIQLSHISAEATDLLKKLLEVDPAFRISAKDALSHPWFTMETVNMRTLATALENIKKYANDKFFNVEKIKPEFSTLTCTPLFNSRYATQNDSPLIFPSTYRSRENAGERGEEEKSHVNCTLKTIERSGDTEHKEAV